MNKSLNELYLEWLVSQIRFPNSRNTYDTLLRQLLITEFVWIISNDENRIADALDLRHEFVNYIGEQGIAVGNQAHITTGASFLEVLVGLSRRLAFTTDETAEGWAWQLLENLELHRFPDPISKRKASRLQDILDCVIWRNYGSDGQGGFFPLIDSEDDQREVELWYQMSAYINEYQTM